MYKKLLFAVCILFVSVTFAGPLVQARSLSEIEKEIAENEKELASLKAELASKQKDLNLATERTRSSSSELEMTKSEIAQMSIELEVIELELAEKESTYQNMKLNQEAEEKKQIQQLSALYINWKDSDDFGRLVMGNENPLKHSYYMEIITETDQEGLNATYKKLADLKAAIEEIEATKVSLDEKRAELLNRQKDLEKLIVTLKAQEGSYATGIKQISPKITATQAELEFLSSEQKALQNYEQSIIGGNASGGTIDLVEGEYYFAGTGRDLYQGHGVGMSQWGAFGAANRGWSAAQILTHYYSGVTIGQATGSVNIIGGRQGIPLEEYVAGAGEVPNKACGTVAQASERPDKYVVDNPSTLWDCWPEEAIKAQMVAYRTYGLRNVNVYPDARSQVYTGTTLKQWAADETRGQVLYYNGQLISAVYSSDNNQGWGTANNDTVWSNYSGDGTAYAYLRAKRDVDFAYRTSWSQWTYRTNSYNINKLNDMIVFSSTASQVDSGARNFMAGVRSSIGTLRSIDFERDPSGRVKKVKLIGDNGTRYIAGWLYKSLWNIWVDVARPSGQADYIYSLTFYLNKR